MTTLNQIIAIEKSVKADSHRAFTGAYQQSQKLPLLAGISRTYQPRDEDGETLPSEQTRVQLRCTEVMHQAGDALIRLFDIAATKDFTNMTAKADVTVDGVTYLTGAPVTYLLFLEKQLTDLKTVVGQLPTLDPAEKWSYNDNAQAWAAEPILSVRTKKTPRNHVKARATDKHPEQVEVFFEDAPAGTWTTVKYSGAMQFKDKAATLARIDRFMVAVKQAREAANMTQVVDVTPGAAIIDFLLETP